MTNRGYLRWGLRARPRPARQYARRVASSHDQHHVLVGMPFAVRLGGAERLLQTFLERADTIGVRPEVVLTALGRAASSQVLDHFTMAGWLADVQTGLEGAADGAG